MPGWRYKQSGDMSMAWWPSCLQLSAIWLCMRDITAMGRKRSKKTPSVRILKFLYKNGRNTKNKKTKNNPRIHWWLNHIVAQKNNQVNSQKDCTFKQHLNNITKHEETNHGEPNQTLCSSWSRPRQRMLRLALIRGRPGNGATSKHVQLSQVLSTTPV